MRARTASPGAAAPGEGVLDGLVGASGTLLVTGIEAHICVAGTVLGALRAGYDVAVAVDAVSARSSRDADVGLGRLQQAGALLVSAEMAVYELLHASGTSEFKAMLPYLKGKV